MKTLKTLLAVGVVLALTGALQAGTISASMTVPTIDGGDQAMLNLSGRFDPGGNEGHIWSNRPIQGQTFTTGTNVNGYDLSSVTLQDEENNVSNNASPFTVRVGTISGNTFTQVATEDSTNTISYVTNNYMTFNFATPVPLSPSTVYGFEWDASGSGFTTWNNADTNYAAGTGYSSGGGGTPNDTALVFRNIDRVFHADLTARSTPPPPPPPPPLPPPSAFNIQAFNVAGGGGSNDNDLNNATEALGIWNFLDANPGFTGTTPAIAGRIYNVQNNVPDVEVRVDYGGGGGDFSPTLAYNTINNDGPGGSGGPIGGGDDFSIRAQAYLEFTQAGTYSIAIGSDDGRWLSLNGFSGSPFAGFIGEGGQITGDADPFVIYFDGTTGHNRTTGAFTVQADDVLVLDGFFFERGGGDSFEISMKSGNDLGFGGTGDGWAPLASGLLGINVTPDAPGNVIPEPITMIAVGMGISGLGGYIRKRRRA